MAAMREVIEGLRILADYSGHDSHDIAAEHDVIFAGPSEEIVEGTDEPNDDGEYEVRETVVKEVDAARLRELGWFIDDELQSWCHFV